MADAEDAGLHDVLQLLIDLRYQKLSFGYGMQIEGAVDASVYSELHPL